jgi:hypothetical protein
MTEYIKWFVGNKPSQIKQNTCNIDNYDFSEEFDDITFDETNTINNQNINEINSEDADPSILSEYSKCINDDNQVTIEILTLMKSFEGIKTKLINIGLSAAALGFVGALMAGPLGTYSPDQILDSVAIAAGIGATASAALNEVEDSQAVAAAEKVEDKVETDPEVEAIINKLSAEEKKEILGNLAKMGITANSSIETVAHKIEDKIGSVLNEIKWEDAKQKIPKITKVLGQALVAQNAVPLLSVAIGHALNPSSPFLTGVGLTFGVGGALIGLAKVLSDGLEEGKEVKEDLQQTDVKSAIDGKKLDLDKLKDATEKAMKGDSTDLTLFLAGVFEGKELSLYEDESPTKEEIAAFEAAVDKLVYMTGMSKEDAIAAIGRVAQTK